LDFGLFIFSERNVMRAMLLLDNAILALAELLRQYVLSDPSIGKAKRAALSANGRAADGHRAMYFAASSVLP
jgi:hypothetical protein